MLSPDRAAIVIGIIEGDEIDIAKILVREIHDRAASTNTNLAFPCFFMQIFMDE